MLRQTHRVVGGGLLALAVFAGSASAECAWVLWSRFNLPAATKSYGIDKDIWQVEAAVPTYAACNDVAKARAARFATPSPAAGNVKTREVKELVGGGFSVRTEFKTPSGFLASMEFRCYPDTVNPTGVKETSD